MRPRSTADQACPFDGVPFDSAAAEPYLLRTIGDTVLLVKGTEIFATLDTPQNNFSWEYPVLTAHWTRPGGTEWWVQTQFESTEKATPVVAYLVGAAAANISRDIWDQYCAIL